MNIKKLENFLKELKNEDVRVSFKMKDSAIVELIIHRKNNKSDISITPKSFTSTGNKYLEITE